jgi:hypothetical protein
MQWGNGFTMHWTTGTSFSNMTMGYFGMTKVTPHLVSTRVDAWAAFCVNYVQNQSTAIVDLQFLV